MDLGSAGRRMVSGIVTMVRGEYLAIDVVVAIIVAIAFIVVHIIMGEEPEQRSVVMVPPAALVSIRSSCNGRRRNGGAGACVAQCPLVVHSARHRERVQQSVRHSRSQIGIAIVRLARRIDATGSGCGSVVPVGGAVVGQAGACRFAAEVSFSASVAG
jgi:hypothetical protein